MSTTAQPFFLRGPSPLAKLTAFGLAALALMFIDSRFQALNSIRSVISTVVHPFQIIAQLPRKAVSAGLLWIESRDALQLENTALKSDALVNAPAVQGHGSLVEENRQLRALLLLREKFGNRGVSAEVVQSGRDPFSQRMLIDRGLRHGVKGGFAVVDAVGVVGQITRAHPFASEVTLLTEKEHAVPVRNERTGNRYLMVGSGGELLPELKFVGVTADIQAGDLLSTSGLDGVYPASLAVAKVVSVSRDASQPFLRIRCVPVAGILSAKFVMIVSNESPSIELPPESALERPKQRTRLGGRL